jgi:hypothetical protein
MRYRPGNARLTMARRKVVSAFMHGPASILATTPERIEGFWQTLDIVAREEVYIDDPRAIALYRKFGFREEGTAKSLAHLRGQYIDTLNMAWLDESLLKP